MNLDNINFFIAYIHMFSSFLWWGLTFFVIFILRPVNKTGAYSPILPRIHKFVIPLSTLSIISGSILIMINTDFHINSLFESLWGYLLIIGGSFSIPVYLIVIFRSKKRDIKLPIRKKKSFDFNNFIPYIAFLLLSITISLMIFVTHWLYPT